MLQEAATAAQGAGGCPHEPLAFPFQLQSLSSFSLFISIFFSFFLAGSLPIVFFFPPIAHADQSSKIFIPWEVRCAADLKKLARNHERWSREKSGFGIVLLVANLIGVAIQRKEWIKIDILGNFECSLWFHSIIFKKDINWEFSNEKYIWRSNSRATKKDITFSATIDWKMFQKTVQCMILLNLISKFPKIWTLVLSTNKHFLQFYSFMIQN